MTRTVAIVQARVGSTRLPRKVLEPVADEPMIALVLKRTALANTLDEVMLATGEDAANDELAECVEGLGYMVTRGPEDDVLRRFAIATTAAEAEIVVRVTGDCPLIDPGVIDSLVALQREQQLDYVTNVKPPSWPDGLDVSVIHAEVLFAADREAAQSYEREHVVPWIWRHSTLEGGDRFSAANLVCPIDMSDARWTVDEPCDLEMIRALAERLGPRLLTAGWRDIEDVFEGEPALRSINASIGRDEGLAKSMEESGVGR
jgi:spore coat polysaccharide biosynthesis protein SpsF (cytidylyltransferase family)